MDIKEREDRFFKLQEHKVPTTKDNYVGIELEFSCPVPYDKCAYDLIDEDLDKYICMGYDGGAYENEYGYEWRVLVKQKELSLIVPRIGRYLARVSARSHLSSGMHVHIDMRNRDALKCFANLVRSQDIIYGVSASHRDGGRWSQRVIETDGNKAISGKSVGINPCFRGSRKTIEVRIRESCVNGDDILRYCRLLLSIVDADNIVLPVKNIGDFKKNIKTAKYVETYLEEKLKANGKTNLLVG